MYTNLKVGIGDPWAGHFKVKVFDWILVILVRSVSIANLGADPPIGSKNENIRHYT